MKIYSLSAKFVTFMHYTLGFKTVDFRNGVFTVFGPPKIYSMLLVIYLTCSNFYMFIPNVYNNFINMAPLPPTIFLIHTCTLLLNASISLGMQVLIPFDEKFKIYENLKYLKTNSIYMKEKKIAIYVKFVYFLYVTNYIFHTIYILVQYKDIAVVIPIFISNLILDAFTMQFVIDVLLMNVSLKIINSKFLSVFRLKNTDVDFERTSVMNFRWKNEKFRSEYNEIDEVLSLLNAYEKLEESVRIISKNIGITVKVFII